jgi:uncharacterized protein (TIGR02300 family)
VAKLELGAKRQCQNCGAKFFDLNKDPIVCPKCGTIFQGAARVERAAAKPEVEEDEVVQPAGVELVSLEEVEATEEKAAEPAVEDIDVEEDEPEPEDPFLEAEEEEEDDVTNLIDGDIAPDEEP